MKMWQKLQWSLAFVSCLGIVLPSASLYAQQPENTVVKSLDLEMNREGQVVGRVVDGAGAPVAEVPVAMMQGRETVATGSSDVDGYFRLAGLKGGPYLMSSAGNVANVRVWDHNTAPPAAHQSALVIAGDVWRGQGCTESTCTGSCGGTCGACGPGCGPLSFLMNPLVIGVAVAAAIAIPLALDDDDDAS